MAQTSDPAPDSVARQRAPLTRPVPPAVAAVATERQLGELRNARIVAGVATIGRGAGLVGIPSLVLAAIGLTHDGALGVVGLLGAVGVVVALIVAAYAVKTWVAGADDWYLYANGIVAAQRRRLEAVTWPEVASLHRQRMGLRARRRGTIMTPDTLRGYKLNLKDGTSTFLTVSDVIDAGRQFAGQLEQLAAGAQIPVYG